MRGARGSGRMRLMGVGLVVAVVSELVTLLVGGGALRALEPAVADACAESPATASLAQATQTGSTPSAPGAATPKASAAAAPPGSSSRRPAPTVTNPARPATVSSGEYKLAGTSHPNLLIRVWVD